MIIKKRQMYKLQNRTFSSCLLFMETKQLV